MSGRRSGLTTRGRCMLAGGLATAVCAVLLDERDLLRIGVFVAALPVLAILVCGRTRRSVSATRTVHPNRLPVGGAISNSRGNSSSSCWFGWASCRCWASASATVKSLCRPVAPARTTVAPNVLASSTQASRMRERPIPEAARSITPPPRPATARCKRSRNVWST